MATVFDYARALAKALRESDEARRMRSLGTAVRKNSKQEKLLRDLRAAQMELEAAQIQGQQPAKAMVAKLQELVGQVEKDKGLAEYLASEHAYGQLLAEVHNVLAEVFQPDVPGALRQR